MRPHGGLSLRGPPQSGLDAVSRSAAWPYVALLGAALIALAPSAVPASTPAVAHDGTVRVDGPYVNTEYGFRFSAPPGFEVRRLAAPAPNHGAAVEIGRARRIEISAAFDAPGYGSTEALLSARLPDGASDRPQRGPARLGGRAAERARYSSGAAAHLVVVRQDPGDEPINYTAELISTRHNMSSDEAVFRRVLASFRFSPRD